MNAFYRKYALLCLFFFGLFLVIAPRPGFMSDIYCWSRWASYIFEHGLGNVYHSDTDYLPLYHYILKLYGSCQGSIEHIHQNIYYLKFITLPFHFVTGLFLALLIKKEQETWDQTILNVLFYVLNIAVLYNSIIWGQIDAMVTSLIFIACFFAYRKEVLGALCFMIVALNLKLQAIIFIPVIGLLVLPVMIQQYTVRRLLQWLLIPLTIQCLIISPFLYAGTFGSLWGVVTGSVGKFPVVSMNAYNLWDFLLDGNLITMQDSQQYWGLTYRNWGLLFFFVSSGIALLPLLQAVYQTIFKQKDFNFPLEQLLLIAGIIPLLFFFLNTQMHERYSHPALVFVIAYAIHQAKPTIAILVSVAYLLNMEGVMKFLELPNYATLIFDRDFIALLYLLSIILLYAALFQKNLRTKNT